MDVILRDFFLKVTWETSTTDGYLKNGGQPKVVVGPLSAIIMVQ